MNNPSYYIDGLLTQGNAALARSYLGITGGGGGIPEAPVDGQLYGRENANWVVVPPAGISDAPVDGNEYSRKNAAWTIASGGGIPDAPSDGSYYTRFNATWSNLPDADGSTTGLLTSADWTTFQAAQATRRPSDGTLYARLNAAWSAGPAPGIADAPDGTQYARFNAAWSAVPAAGIADAPSDGSLYARLNATWSVVPASVPSSRSISTTSPLTGGGDLSADRTLAIAQATSIADGYLSMGDWATFNGKLSDAPSDGNQYARKNAAWDVVAAPAGGASVLEVQVFS